MRCSPSLGRYALRFEWMEEPPSQREASDPRAIGKRISAMFTGVFF